MNNIQTVFKLFIYMFCIISIVNPSHVIETVEYSSIAKSKLDELDTLNKNNDKMMIDDIESEQELDQQRVPYNKFVIPSYYIEALLNKLGELEEQEEHLNEMAEEMQPSSLEKRSKNVLTKKDSNSEQRNNLRRQQAARWDIGFGKRAGHKSKSFMDALYGKRSHKNLSPKVSFGRKQMWDIQYGK